MRLQVEQHTSPFELQQIPTLFANFGKKFKHETVDNIPDLAPAVIVFGVMIAYVRICHLSALFTAFHDALLAS